MPKLLHGDMTDEEILVAVAEAYSDPSNYEPYEKDMGFGCVERKPWIERDRGRYARQGVLMIYERHNAA